MLKEPRTYIKAIIGGLLSGLLALGTALTDGTTVAQVTDGQWVAVAVAVLGVFASVFGVANRPPKHDVSR